MLETRTPCTFAGTETSVWWDLSRCPVPDGYDARLFGPSIESALKKSGYSGPLTITAIGDLKDAPDHVLRACSSTGIVLKHVPFGHTSILLHLHRWKRLNPPPATIMFISDSANVGFFSRSLVRLEQLGYNILRAHQDTSLWKSILEDAMSSGKTRRQEFTGESGCMFCTLCDLQCESPLDDLTTHFKSEGHAQKEFDYGGI